MSDLMCHFGGKIQKLSKITEIPILKDIISKKLGIKSIDMDKYKAKFRTQKLRDPFQAPVYLSIIGKVEDGHMEDGRELL